LVVEEADECASDVHEEVNRKKPSMKNRQRISLLVLIGGEILVLLKCIVDLVNLFSAICDCLHCIEALNVLLHIVYPFKFVARIIQNNSKNYENSNAICKQAMMRAMQKLI
jgi:hypothetical protein